MSEENKDLLAKVAEGIKSVQTRLDTYEGKMNAVDVSAIENATKSATDALEKIQAVENKAATDEKKVKELLEQVETLEKEMAKGGGGDAGVVENAEYKEAYKLYLRKGIAIGDDLNTEVCRGILAKGLHGATDNEKEMFVKDLVSASGPDGGYHIQTDRANFTSQRVFETSQIRAIANVVTTTSNEFEIVLDDDEFVATAVGETTARPKTATSEIGLIKIPLHEYYANPRATQRMLDDAGFDLETWIDKKASDKIGRNENSDFVVGPGTSAKGFLAYDAWSVAGVYERNKVEQRTATGTAGALDNGDDLIDLQTDLLEDYQANAVFGMHRKTFGSVMKLKDDNGQYILQTRFLNEGFKKMLLGQPVQLMADMPVVANNSLSVVYGDFSEFYTIVDRFGIRVLRDPYTSKPYVHFYTTKRTGGAVTNFQAGKILKINAS